MKMQMENRRNNEDITTKRNYVRSSADIRELYSILGTPKEAGGMCYNQQTSKPQREVNKNAEL